MILSLTWDILGIMACSYNRRQHEISLKNARFLPVDAKTELDDQILLNAVDEMERGLIDADLGGGVYKNV